MIWIRHHFRANLGSADNRLRKYSDSIAALGNDRLNQTSFSLAIVLDAFKHAPRR